MLSKVAEVVAPVYQVGGSVRDLLYGREPKDYDFSTPLLPDDIERRIRDAGKRVYLTGRRFGTLGMKVDGHYVEVTTFRTERYDKDSRKPVVEFVDEITHDLSRRDFTVNAMAKRVDGSLIDPFGGQQDLRNGVIRAVGKATERFNDDPLRMLRAFRFAAQFGFSIEQGTLDALDKRAHRVLMVSRERWAQELDKLLLGRYARLSLDLLGRSQLLRFVLPELALQVGYDQNNSHHQHTLWEHTIRVVGGTPEVLEQRWAALLHDVGKPFVREDLEDRSRYLKHDLLGAELVLSVASRLRWSNDLRDAVYALVRDHMREDSPLHGPDRAAH
jgi:putative nucleotidyltransferase with HDIG domain